MDSPFSIHIHKKTSLETQLFTRLVLLYIIFKHIILAYSSLYSFNYHICTKIYTKCTAIKTKTVI